MGIVVQDRYGNCRINQRIGHIIGRFGTGENLCNPNIVKRGNSSDGSNAQFTIAKVLVTEIMR